MDSHRFDDPIPVDDTTTTSFTTNDMLDHETTSIINTATSEPTWTVDVIRKNGNLVVGTLIINNTTLPPRTNKNKKIVWKLPDTTQVQPRFGEQDKKRLWELYKQQKKIRKKQSTTITSSSNNSCTTTTPDDNNNNNHSHHRSTTETISNTSLNHHHDDIAIEQLCIQDVDETTASTCNNNNSCNIESSFISPSVDTNNNKNNTNDNTGISFSNTSQTSTHDHIHLPPPPGFSNTKQQPSSSSSVAGLLLGNHIQVPSSVHHHHHQRYIEISIPTDMTYTNLPVILASAVGHHVANIFQTLVSSVQTTVMTQEQQQQLIMNGMESNSTPNQVQQQQLSPSSSTVVLLLHEWLEYFTEHAHQSLLMNSAQAIATTPTLRYEQWKSLLLLQPQHHHPSSNTTTALSCVDSSIVRQSISPKKYWDCHGWTALPVNHHTHVTMNDHQSITNDDESNNMVLVALTGTTLQVSTGLLSYTLSLVLQQQQHQSDENENNTTTQKTFGFVIVSAILTLQPIGSSTAATSSI